MEAYYNFYYNNEEKIKKYFRYSGYFGMSFLGGYILFYLFNYKRANKLPPKKDIENKIKELKVEDLRKLLRKLVNQIFLKMSHSFDRYSCVKIVKFEDLSSEELENSISSILGNNITIESEKIEDVKKFEDVVEIGSPENSPYSMSMDEERLIQGELNKASKIFFSVKNFTEI